MCPSRRQFAQAMTLAIDARARLLIDAMSRKAVPITVRTLDVGDVLCEGANPWVAERKTADDLARSIKSGHWREQQHRLFQSGLRVVFIVEGDLRATTMPYASVMGACVGAELCRRDAHVFRTWDLDETVHLVVHLFHKVGIQRTCPSGVGPPTLTSKRKRESDMETCWIRQLMCVPSVSENVARCLLEHFGSLAGLQRALSDPESFPRVQIGERSIGKARLAHLRKYLVDK